MTRIAPAILYPFLKRSEASKLHAYPDPATGGDPWTIGIGHTGPEVTKGMVISEARVDEYLRADVAIAARRLANKVKADVIADLTDHQYAALLSFVFNLGTPGTGIWKALNGRRFDQVPVEMMRFVYGGGRKLQGLVNRRTEEVKLWSTDEPGSVDEAPPSSVTRTSPTPPADMAPKPLVKSNTLWTGVGTAVTGAATVATQVQQLAAPQAPNSEIIAKVVAVMAGVIVAAGILIIVLQALERRSQAR